MESKTAEELEYEKGMTVATIISKGDPKKPNPEWADNWGIAKFEGEGGILKVITGAVDKIYNKMVQDAKANPKEKKVTENGQEEKEDDPDLFSAAQQQEVAKEIEDALHKFATSKSASSKLRWIVSVGYEYTLRFRPSKDDHVAHLMYKFLTIGVVKVQGEHEIKAK